MNKVRLNIGCGADLREDYVNIDIEDKSRVFERYGLAVPNNKLRVYHYDIFNLPFIKEGVDEVMCLGFLEHLSFVEERKFFNEVIRVLKPGGKFVFTVPDFESLVIQWLNAKDDFKEFYQIRTDEHWFGNYSRTLENRWGYLTASIFGNQNGEGQFHKNAYTIGKIRSIMEMIDFGYEMEFFNFKDTKIKMIKCVSWKK